MTGLTSGGGVVSSNVEDLCGGGDAGVDRSYRRFGCCGNVSVVWIGFASARFGDSAIAAGGQ